MARRQRARLTASEYLEAERRSTVRHELVQGEAVAMSGASLAHNRIVSNLVFALGPALRARGCDVFSSDMRVKVPVPLAEIYRRVLQPQSRPSTSTAAGQG